MIDIFSLLRLESGETIERVYRSHPLRFFWYFVMAALLLAFPFFFLFDFSGRTWMLAMVFWFTGLVLLWLGFDVWSSSLVIATTRRVIGATRERWGRVRIHEWFAAKESRTPIWFVGRWIPWLGHWQWSREGQDPFVLGWISRPMSEASDVSSVAVYGWRYRLRLVRLILGLPSSRLEEVAKNIDAQSRS